MISLVYGSGRFVRSGVLLFQRARNGLGSSYPKRESTMTKPDSMSLYVTADSLDDAVVLAVDQFKAAAVERRSRGFSVPVVAHEDIVLVGGVWTRAYEFVVEFLPANEDRGV